MDSSCNPLSLVTNKHNLAIEDKWFVDFYLIFVPEAIWFMIILSEVLLIKTHFKAHTPFIITLQIVLIFLVNFLELTLILFYIDVDLVSGAEILAYGMMCVQWISIMNTYQTYYRPNHWANSCLKTVKVFLVFEMAHAVLMTYVFVSNYGLKFENYQGRTNRLDTVLYWIEFVPWMLYYFFFLTMLIRRASYKKSRTSMVTIDNELSLGINLEAPILSKHKVEKEINPYEKASLFSRLLLSWIYPKLKLGSTRPLQESDASVLRINESSSYLAESLEPYLKKYLENPNDNKALLKAVFHRFASDIAWNSFLAITETLMDFSGPVFILLIDAFINGNDPYWRGIALVIYFMFCKLIQAISISQKRFKTDLLGAHLKGGISALIYAKSLKVSHLQNNENSPGFSYAQLVNLMQVDLERISTNIPCSTEVFNWPLQMAVGIFLLWYTAGFIAATASIVLMFILFLVNILLFKRMAAFQKSVMEKKDGRMKYCSELLNAIKILKLYNWETKVGERVMETREAEMKSQAKYLYTLLIIIFLSWGTRNYLAIIIVGSMAVMRVTLSPGTVFSSISVIGILYWSVRRVPDIIDNFLQMMISMKRIQDYLVTPDIVSYNSTDMAYDKPNSMIVIQDCSFSYTSQGPELLTKTELVERPVTLKNINLDIKRGELVAVVGRVASGKSSLLQALINSMNMIKETDNSYMFMLGRVSYVSQESWIQNTTIKNNILFGSEFNENKYRQVIEASQLGPDLNILPGGDLTEIGEKGINLSGGQKARVSIARAAYADTDVVLLDDPLSAVDAHVGREIFNRCIKSYMSGKTIILVTNGQQFLPYVDRVVVMDNGQIIEQGTYQELIENKSFFRENILVNLKVELEEEISTQKIPRGIEDTEAKTHQKNIIEAEDRETGRVSWNVYKTYIEYSGGWIRVILACFFMILWIADKMYSDIFLTKWTDASSKDQEENRTYYIVVYSITTFSINLFLLARLIIVANSGIRAAKTIFKKQFQALLNAPINKFYDVTPSGRILNRLSKDQSVVDGPLVTSINSLIGQAFSAFSVIVICSYVAPCVLIIVPVSMFMGYKIQNFYLRSSRELMRLESISRSPIIQNFSETISGSETIRAYNYEEVFKNKNTQILDKNLSLYFDLKAANAWLSIYLELVSDVLLFVSALFIVITRGDISPGYAGMSLSYAVIFPDNIYWMMYFMASLETNMVSVERTHALALIPPEAERKTIQDKALHSRNWPREGAIKFDNYQMKYRDDTEIILRGVDATILPGERIGIVGRTGSGKSSLCLSLFRIVEPHSGRIFIDGVDISEIGLDILRQKLCIIPQDPVLFKGTVRYNLDPFEENADNELRETISILFPNEDPNQLLDKEVQEGGSNFSVGQKQLICIARAIIRKSKIIFLDEATASVDYNTDNLIQHKIRERFQDRTVLTIAHRINTIMDYDRVLVMDNGRVAEFDTPENLLRQQGVFYRLVLAYKTL